MAESISFHCWLGLQEPSVTQLLFPARAETGQQGRDRSKKVFLAAFLPSERLMLCTFFTFMAATRQWGEGDIFDCSFFNGVPRHRPDSIVSSALRELKGWMRFLFLEH